MAGGEGEKLWFEKEDGEEVSLVEELKKLSDLHTQGVLDDTVRTHNTHTPPSSSRSCTGTPTSRSSGPSCSPSLWHLAICWRSGAVAVLQWRLTGVRGDRSSTP
eukprot:COSAG02_NODE_1129_length_14415_cov_828.291911_11_plen_104_part_00